MTKEELIRHIAKTFASVRYPGIHVSDRCEGREMDAAFAHADWPRATSADFFVWHLDEVHYLTPAGFRYYLPVLMIGVLDFPEDDRIIWQHLFGTLTPKEWMQKPVPGDLLHDLTTMERRAVKQFYQFLYENNYEQFSGEILDGLSGYWGSL